MEPLILRPASDILSSLIPSVGTDSFAVINDQNDLTYVERTTGLDRGVLMKVGVDSPNLPAGTIINSVKIVSKIYNGSVQNIINIGEASAWAEGTPYSVNSRVTKGGLYNYKCKLDHVASDYNPFAQGGESNAKWNLLTTSNYNGIAPGTSIASGTYCWVTDYDMLYRCNTTYNQETGYGPEDGNTGSYWDTILFTEFASGTLYAVNDVIATIGSPYYAICVSSYTASTYEPAVGIDWETYWDLMTEVRSLEGIYTERTTLANVEDSYVEDPLDPGSTWSLNVVNSITSISTDLGCTIAGPAGLTEQWIEIDYTPPVTMYTLNYSSNGIYGTVSGDVDQSIPEGTNGEQVIATPEANGQFIGWDDDYSGATRQDTNVQGNIDVVAMFAIKTFIVTFLAGTGGLISPSSTQTIDFGSNCDTVTATPSTGYHFVNWIVTGGDEYQTTSAITVENIQEDASYTAVFDQIISISISPVTAYSCTNTTYKLSSTITGDDDGDPIDVIWSVSGSSEGSIAQDGTYTAGKPGIDTVRVTSVEDDTKYAEATITVGNSHKFEHIENVILVRRGTR